MELLLLALTHTGALALVLEPCDKIGGSMRRVGFTWVVPNGGIIINDLSGSELTERTLTLV